MGDPLSLLQLNREIKKVIEGTLDSSYWVVAEISQMNINRSGHCYLELVEADELSGKQIARARATIWNHTFRLLKPYFETTTGYEFTPELKILVKVSVEFHVVYGLSLNIFDIDPAYTIGDIAKKRLEVIKKLEEEGVLTLNKDLPTPELPQKIAVISSPTAAGYGDFVDQLEKNPYGYKFYHKLFTTTMQGEGAVTSIISSLEKIYRYEEIFDVVVIIRGGGSKSDLVCFDDYWVAYHIAQFPLPVITGIGHDRDESVSDYVANKSLKTPTAVAEHLISAFIDIEETISHAVRLLQEKLADKLDKEETKIEKHLHNLLMLTRERIRSEQHSIDISSGKLTYNSNQLLATQRNKMKDAGSRLSRATSGFIKTTENHINNKSLLLKQSLLLNFMKQKHKLELFESKNMNLAPDNILKRGFSITTREDKVIKNSNNLSEGDIITTRYFKGISQSKVTGASGD
jgi:exodeoxyribonuclease VII large subunit